MPEGVAAEEPGDEWCTQRGLLDPATCSDVAKHCNDTKQAAKVVQVGLSPLARTLQGEQHCVFVCAELACKPTGML